MYIATDISFEALKLNRSRNIHKNSFYVLCSADYELPFPNNSVDVLCYFGILHHTRNKSDNIQKDKRLVKKEGYVMVVESVDNPILPVVSWLMTKAETSTHEEHISKKKVFSQLTVRKGFEVVFIRDVGTPFFTGMMRFFRNTMLRNKRLFCIILDLDIFVSKTISRIIPFFRAGEIMLLARHGEVKRTD